MAGSPVGGLAAVIVAEPAEPRTRPAGNPGDNRFAEADQALQDHSMSFTFSVPTAPGVGLADVLAAGGPGVQSTEEVPPSGWPGGYVHVWLPGVSTRGVELSSERGELDVRLLTCSAREEYELGVALAGAAARLSGTRVSSEDGWELSADELTGQFGPPWAAEQAEGGPGIAILLAGERGPLSMSGPVRAFHVGARLAGELAAAGPPDELPARFLATMRRTQWPGERYYAASTFQLSGKTSGATVTFAVWSAIATVIGDVELVMLHGGDEAPVPLPRAALPAVAGRYGAWLDEVQLLLEDVPADDWPSVLAAAAPHRASLPD
jgi:hypothetical protein